MLHIRDEIEGVSAILEGMNFDDFQKSYALRRAAERALQIISEAARALPAELTHQYPNVPWTAIIGIGNVLRHDYQHIDDRRLWEIVTLHLPPLRTAVLQMLD